MEEVCSYEEVKEVYESKEKTMEFWRGYMNSLYSIRDPAKWPQRSDSVFVVMPLLGLALLIVIVLFIIWRCQLQKVSGHRPSYTTQTRYLHSHTARSLSRVIIYRETPAQHHPQEPPTRATPSLRPLQRLPPRLSSCSPPPSYEEVTGSQGGGEAPGASYCEPPPKYEEIVGDAGK
ncbi:transmembrane gamma-carboxyglutamic acid protein 3 [Ascaphus truei]|uniref:transmembrane gamma-carboxyglutamic acid protein 3 n=1 Tax=Ascaphus truei TaxID=8439 RepID=UPI003F5904A6